VNVSKAALGSRRQVDRELGHAAGPDAAENEAADRHGRTRVPRRERRHHVEPEVREVTRDSSIVARRARETRNVSHDAADTHVMPEPSAMPDAELLRRARTDDGAFRVVYDRHAERVFRYLASRTDSRDTALDLTSEVFARAWLGRKKFRDEAGGSVLPWLLGIARNVLVASYEKRRIEDAARRRLGVEAHDVGLAEGAVWLPDDPGEVEGALCRLPDRERDAVSLRVLETLPYREIARRLGCSETAARIRVHRGLRRMRAYLEETAL
jgi:RNA polymerase sigma-70 factor (ECF subfamily)